MMGTSKIEWVKNNDGTPGKTWNPITGCSPVSEGCRNCYAKRMANRLKGRYGYPTDDPFRVTFHPDRLDEPTHWKRTSNVFICSMGDLFHKDVKWEWLVDIFQAMTMANHYYFILTKRPGRMKAFFQNCEDWDITEWPGVWLGVSVENQKTADERIPVLCQIPAPKKFISVEPMLEGIHFYRGWFGINGINWVLCGEETGPKARPLHPDWVRSLRDQCQAAGIPFFLKQMEINGKVVKMPKLDGKIWEEYPCLIL